MLVGRDKTTNMRPQVALNVLGVLSGSRKLAVAKPSLNVSAYSASSIHAA